MQRWYYDRSPLPLVSGLILLLSPYSITDLRLDVGTARPSILPTTNLTCTVQSGPLLIMQVLAHPHIPSACHKWLMRPCGIRHNLVACGPKTARNLSSWVMVTSKATALTPIMSSAGKATLSNAPWTVVACSTPARMEGLSSRSLWRPWMLATSRVAQMRISTAVSHRVYILIKTPWANYLYCRAPRAPRYVDVI